MLQFRNGCFETNSSSAHALIVKKEDKPLDHIDCDWRLDTAGLVSIRWDELEYGRAPFDLLADWYGRLCYALASVCDSEGTFEELEDMCIRHVNGCTGIEIIYHREEDRMDEYYRYGCVDHQSAGLLNNFLFSRDISLEDFIFNDRFIVVIDGDEYGILDTFSQKGLLNNDALEGVYT